MVYSGIKFDAMRFEVACLIETLRDKIVECDVPLSFEAYGLSGQI